MIRKELLVFLMLPIFLLSCGGRQGGAEAVDLDSPHVYTNPTGDEFPILAYFPPEATPERFREMKEAGFNLAIYGLGTAEQLRSLLDSAAGTGVKIIAGGGEVLEKTDSVVPLFRDNPSLGGWYFGDEPNIKAFPSLAESVRRLRKEDDTHLLYVNLLPVDTRYWFMTGDKENNDVTYQQYVDEYLEKLNLGLISYDFYCVLEDENGTFLKEKYYENLEVISASARRTGQPFWAFTLSWAHRTSGFNYPHPTRQAIRLQLFSNLAYGAQGVQYFTYCNAPGSPERHSKDAPLVDGKRTEIWRYAQEINREIQNLSWVFLGANVVEISHTGSSIALGTKPMETPPAGFKEISTDGSDVVVSRLDNGDNRFLMVMNADLHNVQKVTVVPALDGMDRVMPDGGTVPASAFSDVQYLDPGDYLLFRWK